MAKTIMIQGTMSSVGKSLLTAGLCRLFRQDGFRVAPFKSQNMSGNAFLTAGGLEMSSAQAMQAEAAGVAASVLMNPILLKPVSDMGAHVVVNGESRGHMRAADYFAYKKSLVPDILRAFRALADTSDIIVIEGAGSPAEINLKKGDIVNMGLARLTDSPVLLAGDIDCGGVFAQLVGTLALLEDDERARVKGCVINKFRGDIEILRPGLAMLEEKSGKPVVGVVPYLPVDIEEEDSLVRGHKPLPGDAGTQTGTGGTGAGKRAVSETRDSAAGGSGAKEAAAGGEQGGAAYRGNAGERGGAAYREAQYDMLAAALREHLDMSFIYRVMEVSR